MTEPDIKDFIGIFPGLYSPEFCRQCIDMFELGKAMGLTATRQHSGYKKTDADTNQLHITVDTAMALSSTQSVNSQFVTLFWSTWFRQYIEKYSILDQFKNLQIHNMKIQKTEVGGGYHVWHHETSASENYRRLFNVMVYLNDVEEGGETEFLYLHRRVKPTAGTAIIYPAGFTHTHRGNPPISGTKYLLNGWLEF